jgi:formylglycine-generating enzyme
MATSRNRARPVGRRPHQGSRRRPMATPLGVQRLEPRLALAAVEMILVTVGNPGNAADPATGFGRVVSPFQIGKYEVTLGEYTAFLNAVAADDPNAVYVTALDPELGGDRTSAGIVRSGSPGSFTYTVTGPNGITPEGADDPANRPITYVTWFDAARFANWMANGQPVGTQTAATTENGAYDLTTSQAVAGVPPARNATNPNTGTAPTFFLPSENEWYKAAYYDPALRAGRGGYYRFATRSNQEPGNEIGAAVNRVNYIASDGRMTVTQQPLIDPAQNYLTNVGAMSGSWSPSGTFDQNGNVWELLDTGGSFGGNTLLRGGAWTSFTTYLASGYRLSVLANSAASNAGFRLAAAAAPAQQVTFTMLSVADAGNAADTATGFGAVGYEFTIARTAVTIGQYTSFLNAVAKTDPHRLYNPALGTDRNVGGITRVGRPGSYSYSVLNVDGNTADRPITYVSWFDTARFANWMANGQPRGPQTARTTENGSYNLARSTGGRAVPRNVTNPNTRRPPTFFIPTENEWYKAAYSSPDKGGSSVPGYWTFATQSDSAPTNLPPESAPVGNANYLVGPVYCVTQSNVFDPGQNYLTAVDAFADSGSRYGTLNQNGSVYQWNDLAGRAGLHRGLRGGFWAGGAVTLRSSTFTQVPAVREANDSGFRLVGGPVAPAARAAATAPQAAPSVIVNRFLTTAAFAALGDTHAVGTGSQTKYPRQGSHVASLARAT